jgi:hypothetical protein
MEALKLINRMKTLVNDLKLKDDIIKGNKDLIRLVEGDIANMAIREHENSLR